MAAAWVVAKHFAATVFGLAPFLAPVRSLAEAGHLGVELFFVLSGFVISHNYADRFAVFTRDGYRSFMAARVARIYPVHVASIVGLLAMTSIAGALGLVAHPDAPHTVWNVTANLLMLQESPFGKPINIPAWSVACEFGAYLLFPLLAWLLVRMAPAWALAAGLLLACGGAAAIAAAVYPETLEYHTNLLRWARIVVWFPVGCLLWVAWRQWARPSQCWDVVAATAAGAAVVLLLVVPANAAVAYLAAPFLAVVVVADASATGLLGRLLSCRAAQWLGRVSYSLYMTHFAVLMVVHQVAGWEKFAGAGLTTRLGLLAMYALVIVAAAAGMFYLVEEPGRRLLRYVLAARQPKMSQS